MADCFYAISVYRRVGNRIAVLDSDLEVLLERDTPNKAGFDFAHWLRSRGVNGRAGTFVMSYFLAITSLPDEEGKPCGTYRMLPHEQDIFCTWLTRGLESPTFRRYMQKGL